MTFSELHPDSIHQFNNLKIAKKLHYSFVLGSRMPSTSGQNRSSLQLAAIHEMRKSIMHLILFSVDQDSVSQWHCRDYKHCINLLPALLQYPYSNYYSQCVPSSCLSL